MKHLKRTNATFAKMIAILISTILLLGCGGGAPPASSAPASPAASSEPASPPASSEPASPPASAEPASPEPTVEAPPDPGAITKPANFPNKEITLIVPYAAGGAYDSMGRLLQHVLKRDYDVNIVVKNVTGGSGAVGAMEALTSRADGYTLCMSSGTFVAHIATGKVSASIDSLVPICSMSEDPVVLITRPGRYDTFEDFVKVMKEKPNEVNIGTPGLGNANNAFAQILCNAVGGGKVINLEGGARIATELLGDHVDAGSVKPNDAIAQIQSKQLQMICSFTKERLAVFPDVPTAAESGIDMFPYGDGCRLYVFMIAPKGLPADVQTYLEALFKAGTQSKDFQDMAKEAGFEANSHTGDKLMADVRALYDIAPILEENIFSKAGQ